MEMIIGGSCQGKKEYAEKEFPSKNFLDGEACSLEEILQAEGVYHFHLCIRRMMMEKSLPEDFADLIWRKNPDIIIISDEIGYGVVPMDAFERAYREKVGRICTELASHAGKVIRVICGTGMVIKNA